MSAGSSIDESRTVASHGRVCINGSYNALGGMPWNDVRKQVLTVEFQSDMAAFSYCNLNYLLLVREPYRCHRLVLSCRRA